MKTKILSALLAAAMILSLTACRGSSDKPVINNNAQSSSSSKTEEDKEIEETEKSTDSEPSETAEETEETEDYGGDEVNYSDKIYRVGEDIPAGGYAEYLYNTTDSILPI